MFNFSVELDNGGMVLLNTYQGTDSVVMISPQKVDKVKKWLGNQLPQETDQDFDILMNKGYFVALSTDEKLLRELSYCKTRMDNNLHLIIYVTQRCNFRCKYCGYSFVESSDMTQDIQDGIVNFIRKNIGKYDSIILDWFGGEPTLNIDAIEYISSKVIDICQRMKKPLFSTITTNGFLLTPKNIKRLFDCKVFKYVVTLDGLRETHDRLRVLGDESETFDIIVQNLKYMKENIKQNFDMWIRTNITTEIAQPEYLKKYYSFFDEEFGDDNRFSLFIRPTNDLGGERVERIKHVLMENSDMSMSDVFREVSQNIGNITYKGNARDLNVGGCRCPASRLNKYNILVDGTINKCDDGVENEFSIGNLLPNGVMEIDESVHAKWLFNNSEDKFAKCDDCALSMICNMDGCPRNRLYTGKTQCPLDEDEFVASLILFARENDVEEL